MNWNSFAGQGGPYGCARGLPNRVQNSQKRPFSAKSGSGGSKLVEQCGTRVEQVRAHPWCCIGTVLGVREGHVGVPEGSQKGPKRPKTAFLGHKQIWWLQTGGTVWKRVEQVRAHLGWCIGSIALVRSHHWGAIDG